MQSKPKLERIPSCDRGNNRRGGAGKRIGFVVALAAGAVFLTMAPCACTSRTAPPAAEDKSAAAPDVPQTSAATTDTAKQEQKLPRLLDLGAHSCIPCKKMAPILDELKKNYADVFKTEFIDVWKNPDAGNRYGIQSIPTQIFFDAEGKELYRHVGFMSKDAILAAWEKHGVDVEKR